MAPIVNMSDDELPVPDVQVLSGDDLLAREAALREALLVKVWTMASSASSAGSSSSAIEAPPAPIVKSKWNDDEEEDQAAVAAAAAAAAAKKAALAAKRAARKRERDSDGPVADTPSPSSSAGAPRTGTPDVLAPSSSSSALAATESPDSTPLPLPFRPAKAPIASAAKAIPLITGCRSVDHYEKLNKIDEGAYGVVYRARDTATGDIVALKRLKIEKEKEGFPITSLREINTLLLAKHRFIVNVREIVIGESIDQIYIAMDFVAHDIKYLMETMSAPFRPSEVKTILRQLLLAVGHLHENWIIHRDLKTSNMLFTNHGELKLGDFGLARLFGDPMGKMTQLVVTLWYRAPELLLGSPTYTTAIDMWAIGCIFAELIQKKPLFPGLGELDQLQKIFALLGRPSEAIWPGFDNLPYCKKMNFQAQPYNFLAQHFNNDATTRDLVTPNTIDLLDKLLTYDPSQRITADQALKHPYFTERPLPKDPSMFPSWPSRAELKTKQARIHDSPSAPNKASAAEDDELEDIRDAKERAGFVPSAPEFRLSFQ